MIEQVKADGDRRPAADDGSNQAPANEATAAGSGGEATAAGSGNEASGFAELAAFAELRRTGDVELRNRLVEQYLPLARHLARRFANRGVAIEDLGQVAGLGLVKAVDRFDPDRGVAFTTFATPTVLGEVKRHFRDRSWAMRVPRSVQERYLLVNRQITHLTQVNGRSPTTAELAQAARCSEEEVIEVLDAGASYRSASLDAPSGEGDGSGPLAERLGEQDVDEAFALENRLVVRQMLGTLPQREQLILRLRFEEDMSQREIAARLDISQMHVSRLLARSLASLRSHLDAGPTAVAS